MCCEAVGQLEKVNNTSLKKHLISAKDDPAGEICTK